jgi:hypothetical protein
MISLVCPVVTRWRCSVWMPALTPRGIGADGSPPIRDGLQ